MKTVDIVAGLAMVLVAVIGVLALALICLDLATR